MKASILTKLKVESRLVSFLLDGAGEAYAMSKFNGNCLIQEAETLIMFISKSHLQMEDSVHLSSNIITGCSSCHSSHITHHSC